eukprot:24116_1
MDNEEGNQLQLLDALQTQCEEKDQIIETLRAQYDSLQNTCMELTKENIELKQKYASVLETTTSSTLETIQSAHNALQDKISDLAHAATLLSQEQITNVGDAMETENVIMLDDEHEVQDIESSDEEFEHKMQVQPSLQQDERKQLLDTLQTVFEQFRINHHPMEALVIFHPFEDQVVDAWNLVKQQYHHTMFQKLCSGDEDTDIIAYSILFDLMIACYNVMNKQYEAQKLDINSNVIDVMLLNIKSLYQTDTVVQWINEILDSVTKAVFERYDGCLNQENIKIELKIFAIECCKIIWNVIHHGYQIYPLEMYFDADDIQYDANIHEKTDCNSDGCVEYCTFPCIVQNSIPKTKMTVVCK